MQLITVEELSLIIRKSAATIRNDLTRRPHSLPPVHRLPGCRRVFFKNVDAWLSGETETVPEPEPAKSTSKRGRPSHASRLNTQ